MIDVKISFSSASNKMYKKADALLYTSPHAAVKDNGLLWSIYSELLPDETQ